MEGAGKGKWEGGVAPRWIVCDGLEVYKSVPLKDEHVVCGLIFDLAWLLSHSVMPSMPIKAMLRCGALAPQYVAFLERTVEGLCEKEEKKLGCGCVLPSN